VRGGGFAADEQSVRAMGMSGAFLSSDDDPAVIFDNSAAIAFIDHHQLLVGGHLEWARTTLEGADPFPGSDASEKSANGVRLQPAASYIAPFSKQFVMGIGFRTPFDLATIWSDPETFSGRFLAQDTQIVSREILPTIAIRLADRLSIGAGVGVLFSDLSMSRHLPAIDPFTFATTDAAAFDAASDMIWAVRYRGGIVARFTNGVSLALSYDGPARIDFTGTGATTQLATSSAELDDRLSSLLPNSPVDFEAALELPAQYGASLSYSVDDWNIVADVRWQGWSTLEAMRLEFEDVVAQPPDLLALDATLLRDFEDRLQFRLGVERKVSPAWTLRAGFVHDRTPAPVASVSPAFVDADRNGVSAGATWSHGDLRIDMAQTLSFFSECDTGLENPERYNGSYQSLKANFGVSLAYRF
jgi:long-chain fatty acid transport protein